MRISRIATGAVALGMTAVLITACSSGDSSGGSSSGVVNAWAGEPQNPLIPTNTSENQGGRVLDSLFAGLVSYTADGGTENEVAESIESTDGQNFTVKLKDGWTFTDGTPVTAKSFVDAWNFGALSTNAQIQASFFDPIKGYDEVAAEVPTAQTMSGLKVVDDSTFTIELKQPESAFPDRLGFTAYYPLPEVAFKDMTAFGENPVGNGPYKLDGAGAWQHNVRIDTVVNPDYNGNRKPKNAGVDFIMYNSLDTAYTDLLANNVDVLDQVPPSAVTTFESDLAGRTVNQPSATIETFTIPGRLAHFSGEEGMLRRQAISMAINRDQITQQIFNKTRTPALDFTSPAIEGWNDSLTGNGNLKFDPEAAKPLGPRPTPSLRGPAASRSDTTPTADTRNGSTPRRTASATRSASTQRASSTPPLRRSAPKPPTAPSRARSAPAGRVTTRSSTASWRRTTRPAAAPTTVSTPTPSSTASCANRPARRTRRRLRNCSIRLRKCCSRTCLQFRRGTATQPVDGRRTFPT